MDPQSFAPETPGSCPGSCTGDPTTQARSSSMAYFFTQSSLRHFYRPPTNNTAPHSPMGGMYMVSEKQASSSLRISHLLRSYDAVDEGEWVKPTPDSQMYSQLSIVDMSSGLSSNKQQQQPFYLAQPG